MEHPVKVEGGRQAITDKIMTYVNYSIGSSGVTSLSIII